MTKDMEKYEICTNVGKYWVFSIETALHILFQFDLRSVLLCISFLDVSMIAEEVNNCIGTKKTESIRTKTFKNGAQSMKDVDN